MRARRDPTSVLARRPVGRTPFRCGMHRTTGYEPSPDDFKWEFSNVSEDFSQANNLTDNYPDKLKKLQDVFDVEAKK